MKKRMLLEIALIVGIAAILCFLIVLSSGANYGSKVSMVGSVLSEFQIKELREEAIDEFKSDVERLVFDSEAKEKIVSDTITAINASKNEDEISDAVNTGRDAISLQIRKEEAISTFKTNVERILNDEEAKKRIIDDLASEINEVETEDEISNAIEIGHLAISVQKTREDYIAKIKNYAEKYVTDIKAREKIINDTIASMNSADNEDDIKATYIDAQSAISAWMNKE